MNTRFRKIPVEVEALRFTGRNVDEVADFIGEMPPHQPLVEGVPHLPDLFAITTLEGTMYADPGDWIIRGVAGEFYPCKPHIFEQTYEPVVAVREGDE